MAKLDWGMGIGLHFRNNSEYYEILGFLTKPRCPVVIYTHDNDMSGAWAGQGKLETKIPKHDLPDALKRSFIQSGDNRLSVSDYVENLIVNHNFNQYSDPTGNCYTFYRYPISHEEVLSTIPYEYVNDFYRGYNM